MNIEDAKGCPNGPKTFKAVMQAQKELFGKYTEIEGQSGIELGLLPKDRNIDSPLTQYVIKDFAWRVVEEVAEAIEAHNAGDILHMKEELADSLHFLMELFILANISEDSVNVVRKTKALDAGWGTYYFTQEIGCAMNCLKQKPWKQTHVVTDVNKFYAILLRVLYAWQGLVVSYGSSVDEILGIYYKKHEVNKFRQRSGY